MSNTFETSQVNQSSIKVWSTIFGTDSPASLYDSYNVSSLTDNGSGDYSVNINNNMFDANYGAYGGQVSTTSNNSIVAGPSPNSGSDHTTSASRILCMTDTLGLNDRARVGSCLVGDLA